MQDVAHGGACIIDLCPVLLHHLNFNGHLANRLAVRPLKEYEVQQKDEQRDPPESHPSGLGVVATLAQNLPFTPTRILERSPAARIEIRRDP